MPEKEFNLIDEPWVRVMRQNGEIEEVSLCDALLRAHEFADLAGETQTQNIAVLRLLLAVLHTVFTRVDENGEDAPLEDEDDAFDRWDALWENGSFPEKPIVDYLKEWHERFWLFHPERPFMQAVSAENGTANDAKKLIGEISESNHKIRLFQMRSGVGKEAVSYAEAARWLLHLNGFDDRAVKPKDKLPDRGKIKVAWLGRVGLTYACGKNLFETLMLNLTVLNGNDEPWEENHPTWEMPEARHKELKRVCVPDNPAELLTEQSRLIFLQRKGDSVSGYAVKGGDVFDTDANAFIETMTAWRYVKETKKSPACYLPAMHSADRQMWRDFANLFLSGNDNSIPGVVAWTKKLKKKHCLDRKQLIQFNITGMAYGSNDSLFIDAFGDELTFHTALFSEVNEGWLNRIGEEVAKCDQIASKVGLLSQAIHLASGGDPKDKKKAERMAHARERWYDQIDEPFRKWLRSLDPETMSIDEAVSLWLRQAHRIAYTLGEQMVKRAGSRVLFGRKADGKMISAAQALLEYKGEVNHILRGGKMK